MRRQPDKFPSLSANLSVFSNHLSRFGEKQKAAEYQSYIKSEV